MAEDNIKDGVDEVTGIKTTGHEWDGIKELDTPMPRWWLWTFFATIVFAIGYVIYYPSIPLMEGSTMGISGTTNRSILKEEMAKVNAGREATIELLKTTKLADIRKNEDLTRFAVAGGASLFKVNCTQCHGSGATGSPGYPNLNDDDWIWGGDMESLYETIAHGIRNGEDDDERTSQMPSFGKDGVLDKQQISEVTEYVLKLSKKEHDGSLAETGKKVFADNCASCHGDDGRGGREFGAPNLADAISLYGHSRATISAQVTNPRHGVMPPWLARLGEANVKQLTFFVHSLGGGEKDKPE